MRDIQQLEGLRDSAIALIEPRDLLFELVDGPVRMRASSDEEVRWWVDKARHADDSTAHLGAVLASGELLDEPASIQLS
jgi:hypothetical protein